MYKSLVRSHLEYCVHQVWSLHLIKNIKLIENVQHSATRMIHELHGKAYEQRLIEVKLTTRETRCLRVIQLKCLKYKRVLIKLAYLLLLTICQIVEVIVLSYLSKGLILI